MKKINRKIMILLIAVFAISCVGKKTEKFTYNNPPLVMTPTTLTDALGGYDVDSLPTKTPKVSQAKLTNVTPLVEKMWNIALDGIELNITTNDYGTYFAAGRRYTDRVYTRDIAFAGILGLNYIYPELMKRSLEMTREVRWEMGYNVSAKHVIDEIDVPWNVITDNEREIMARYRSNSVTRRTDDVVWMWAADNLFKIKPEIADWECYYMNGERYFKKFYNPWFDESEGLYRCQPVFQDLQALLARSMGTKVE